MAQARIVLQHKTVNAGGTRRTWKDVPNPHDRYTGTFATGEEALAYAATFDEDGIVLSSEWRTVTQGGVPT